jgi:hypothetical protein
MVAGASNGMHEVRMGTMTVSGALFLLLWGLSFGVIF